MAEHVCGLSGYNPMIDSPCPGCVEANTDTRTGWQHGDFARIRVEGEDQPCPAVYVELPGRELMPCSHHADAEVNKKRAAFIAEAINCAIRGRF